MSPHYTGEKLNETFNIASVPQRLALSNPFNMGSP